MGEGTDLSQIGSPSADCAPETNHFGHPMPWWLHQHSSELPAQGTISRGIAISAAPMGRPPLLNSWGYLTNHGASSCCTDSDTSSSAWGVPCLWYMKRGVGAHFGSLGSEEAGLGGRLSIHPGYQWHGRGYLHTEGNLDVGETRWGHLGI